MLRLSLRRIGAALATVVILTGFAASVAVAGNGNNGTVKIQEGAINADPVTRNEPHVCTFHALFIFADAEQTGSWWIDQQSPTGSDPSGLNGTYSTDANGEYATVEYGLPAGHYSLYWEGRDDQNIKHKTFWVTCDNAPGPIGGGGGIG